MQTQDFAQFVARQQPPTLDAADDSLVNWTEVRETWLQDLDGLYAKIGDFLSQFVADGSVRFSFGQVELTEEDLGSYPAQRMDIRIGRQNVFLEPIGTLLIGCRGRVDVVGAAGRAQLMLVNKSAKSSADLLPVRVSAKGSTSIPPVSSQQQVSWVWKIASRQQRGTFVDLEKESFFVLLMEIVGA